MTDRPDRDLRATDWLRTLTSPRTIGIVGVVSGLVALLARAAAVDASGPRRADRGGVRGARLRDRGRATRRAQAGWAAIVLGIAGTLGAVWVQTKDAETLDDIFTGGSVRGHAPVRDAARVRRDGRDLLRAVRGREHRPRGDDARWGPSSASGAPRLSGSWVVGIFMAMLFGGLLALIHAVFCIHLRADQIVSGFAMNFLALGLTGYLFSSIYPDGTSRRASRGSPTSISRSSTTCRFSATSSGTSTCSCGSCSARSSSPTSCSSGRRSGCASARSASTRERPTPWGSPSTASATARSSRPGVLAALGGAFLSIGFVGSFAENMTSGRGFIALAAVIFGKWRPGWAFAATLLFGFGFALADPASARGGGLREPDLDASVHPHAGRSRRPDRQVDPAGGRWARPYIKQ